MITSQYKNSPQGSKNKDKITQIKKDGEWITAFDEGDLLAHALEIPIRIITVNQDESGCGVSDILTFAEANKPRQEWEMVPEQERPQEYVLIVDLVGHFVYAERS